MGYNRLGYPSGLRLSISLLGTTLCPLPCSPIPRDKSAADSKRRRMNQL